MKFVIGIIIGGLLMSAPVAAGSAALVSVVAERSEHFGRFNTLVQMVLAGDSARPQGINQADLQ